MVFKKLICLIIAVMITAGPLFPADNLYGTGKFHYGQLKYEGDWDPYPNVDKQISYYLSNTTSIDVADERKVVTLNEPELFLTPFIVFTGRGAYPEFAEDEISNLRRYLLGGGILFIDAPGEGGFYSSVERTMKRVFPDKEFKKVPNDYAILRSFYLVEFVSGRTINKPYLTGITVESRIAVIRSHNDLLGVWPADRAGNPEFQLIPGKPGQRKEGVKLTLNILVYSLSGTYKNDDVHLPFIKRKLKR